MFLSKIRDLLVKSKVRTHAPSRVTSLSSSCEMRNNPFVVKPFLIHCAIVSPITFMCCSVCVLLCVCVFRSAAAVFACVWTQQQKTDEGCDGGTTESSRHPKQSGDEESVKHLLSVCDRQTGWMYLQWCHISRSQSWWPKCKRSAWKFREATLRCTPWNLYNLMVTHTQAHTIVIIELERHKR